MTSILQAQRVSMRRRLDPTSLTLNAGELVALIGRNGSGKTSLLQALAGSGGTGDVAVCGQALHRLGPVRRPFLLGYVPASRELAWPIAVADLIALGIGSDPEDARVTAAIRRFELLPLAQRPADRLSTGERSRALLARAFAPAPPLLLLDEPFANLDPDWQLRLADLLREETAAGRAVIVAMHDLILAERLATRVLVMDGGRVVADGPPEQVIGSPATEAAFGLVRGPEGWRRP